MSTSERSCELVDGGEDCCSRTESRSRQPADDLLHERIVPWQIGNGMCKGAGS
ncbi:hypothetical protein [Bradyrhizobium nanningense]|uniref:hypothetical protein n=1 Tax=Bradyrhizobium nanningense TaxID=1325118 RepID=UPI001ABF3286